MSIKSHHSLQRNCSDSERTCSRNQRCCFGLILFFLSQVSFSTPSYSPRKGPPSGEKHVPLQEVKATKPDPSRINPGAEIPQLKKQKWRLVEREYDGGKETGVPVYSFSSGKCDLGIAGRVPPGQMIELTEVKVCGRNYYKFEYSGTPSKSKPNAEFFVDGLNIRAVN